MKTWRNSWFIPCKGGYFCKKVVGGKPHLAFLNQNERKEWVLKSGGMQIILRDNSNIKGYEGVANGRIYHLFHKSGKMLLCSREIPVNTEEEQLNFIAQLQKLKEAI